MVYLCVIHVILECYVETRVCYLLGYVCDPCVLRVCNLFDTCVCYSCVTCVRLVCYLRDTCV